MPRRFKIVLIVVGFLVLAGILLSRVRIVSDDVTLSRAIAPSAQEVSYRDGWKALSSLDFNKARKFRSKPFPEKLVDAAQALSCARYAEADRDASPLLSSKDLRIRKVARDIIVNSRLARNDYPGALEALPPYEELTGQLVTHTVDSTNRLLIEAWSRGPVEEWNVPDTAVVLKMKRNMAGIAMVLVRINAVPVWFAIDTGADFTVVTDELAQRIGVESASEMSGSSSTSTSKKVAVGAGIIKFLDVGAIEVKHHRCYIIDQDDLRFKLGPVTMMKIEGIVGWNFLQHLRTTLDFDQQQVRFEKPASPLPDDKRTLYWTGLSQPLIRMYADNGTPLLLFFDSGANRTNLYKSIYRKLILEIANSKETMVGGAGGFERQSKDIVNNLPLYGGGAQMRFKEIAVTTPVDVHQSFAENDGVAGYDIAGGGAIVLDPTAGEYLLLPPSDEQ